MNDIKMSTRRGKLAAIAEQRGESIDKLIPRTVAETGSVLAAAAELGVAPNTIRYHLTRLGYKAKFIQSVVWERTDEADQEKEHVLEPENA